MNTPIAMSPRDAAISIGVTVSRERYFAWHFQNQYKL